MQPKMTFGASYLLPPAKTVQILQKQGNEADLLAYLFAETKDGAILSKSYGMATLETGDTAVFTNKETPDLDAVKPKATAGESIDQVPEDIAKVVRKKIGKGYIDKALELLLEHYPKNQTLINIEQRLSNLHTDIISGIVSIDVSRIALNQITHSILTFLTQPTFNDEDNALLPNTVDKTIATAHIEKTRAEDTLNEIA